MTALFGLLAGLVLALVVVRVARAKGPQRATRLYGIALVIAALVYVGLALVGRASGGWLMREALGVVLYGAVAAVGVRRWPALLALGWATHVGWDVLLHLVGPGAAFTPPWYPWLCVSFDLLLAAAVLAEQRRVALAPPSSGS